MQLMVVCLTSDLNPDVQLYWHSVPLSVPAQVRYWLHKITVHVSARKDPDARHGTASDINLLGRAAFGELQRSPLHRLQP